MLQYIVLDLVMTTRKRNVTLYVMSFQGAGMISLDGLDNSYKNYSFFTDSIRT